MLQLREAFLSKGKKKTVLKRILQNDFNIIYPRKLFDVIYRHKNSQLYYPYDKKQLRLEHHSE